MTLPVKITASTVPIPSPMICLVNTSPMIPDVQKQVTSKTFLPIPMPLPSLSPIVAASASAGLGTSFILTIVAAPIPVTTIAKNNTRSFCPNVSGTIFKYWSKILINTLVTRLIGICNNSYNLNSFPFKIASINTQKQ